MPGFVALFLWLHALHLQCLCESHQQGALASQNNGHQGQNG